MQIKKKIMDDKMEYYNNIRMDIDNKLTVNNNEKLSNYNANTQNNGLTKDRVKNEVHNLVFASSKIDLTKVEISEGVTDITFNIIFGSVKIIIPQDVTVITDTSNIFSEFKIIHEKNGIQNPNKIMKIHVKSVFSSVYVYKK